MWEPSGGFKPRSDATRRKNEKHRARATGVPEPNVISCKRLGQAMLEGERWRQVREGPAHS
eukprot:1751654-Pyramimonas_sp.AAC.1